MSRLHVLLFAFLVLGAVVAGNLIDSTTDNYDEGQIITTMTTLCCTKLTILEKFLKTVKSIGKKPEKIARSSCFGDFMNKLKDKFNIIVLGTYWCGAGNISANNDELGYLKLTDACCKEHDKCLCNIPAGETLMNLKNNGFFTRSACSCDNKFYKCLKNVVKVSKNLLECVISKKIGKTYFNLAKPQCFFCSCPKNSCKLDDGTECKDHCNAYKWKDNLKF